MKVVPVLLSLLVLLATAEAYVSQGSCSGSDLGTEAGLKQEGEDCGSCYCPPDYTAGECAPGLKCVHNDNIPDAPGVCQRTGLKQEGEDCGSCYCPPDYTAGECAPGLKCVHNDNIPDAPGVC